jgi:hypothetical protein
MDAPSACLLTYNPMFLPCCPIKEAHFSHIISK